MRGRKEKQEERDRNRIVDTRPHLKRGMAAHLVC